MADELDDLLEPGERVIFRAPRSRSAVRVVLITAFVAVLFWSLFIATSAPGVTWPFGAALAAGLAAALNSWLQPDPMVDRPLGVAVTTIGPWGESRGRSLDAAEIEGVRIEREHDNSRPAVLIEGDRQRLIFGQGLPEASLEYLRNAVLAKLAKYHGARC